MEYYLTSKENANVESHSQISVAEHPTSGGGEPLQQAVLDPERWKQILKDLYEAKAAEQKLQPLNQQVCPNCGRCPCCGRGGYWGYPYQPNYPIYVTSGGNSF